jgi:hypothetical protein
MTNAIEGEAGVIGTITAVVRSGASVLVQLIDRLVHGIRVIAPVVLGLGCQSTSDVAKVAPPAAEIAPGPVEPPAETGPRQLGKFTITFYYVIGEDEVTAKAARVAANDNRKASAKADAKADAGADADAEIELASITSNRVTLYGGGDCEPIAEVSKEFASQLALQGTGKLHDGRVVNIWGACNCRRSPCFKVTQAQWGTSSSGT